MGKGPGETFFQEDMPVVNRYMKRCSTSVIMREMPIKTTMICHRQPVRVAVVKREEITSASENVEKR